MCLLGKYSTFLYNRLPLSFFFSGFLIFLILWWGYPRFFFKHKVDFQI